MDNLKSWLVHYGFLGGGMAAMIMVWGIPDIRAGKQTISNVATNTVLAWAFWPFVLMLALYFKLRPKHGK